MKILKPKKEQERKVKKIDLRVTAKEYSAISSLSERAKISRSSYIIQAVLSEKVLTHIDAQAVFQLRKIGNNLNQMTKQIHILSKFSERKEHDLDDFLSELKSLNEEMNRVNEYIINTNHAGKN